MLLRTCLKLTLLAATGLAVYRFPKEREYFVELKLKA